MRRRYKNVKIGWKISVMDIKERIGEEDSFYCMSYSEEKSHDFVRLFTVYYYKKQIGSLIRFLRDKEEKKYKPLDEQEITHRKRNGIYHKWEQTR